MVFHVSQLKKMIGEHTEVHQIVSYISETHGWKAVPEEVFGYRKNSSGVWEVLISWKGLPPHEAMWEVCDDFQQQFPDFHPENKVDLEECNDRPPIILQYSSRGGRKGRHV
ncbi:ty3-gypsy retroelement transposase [Cucumis melo var. makuwa]|uniref:Ty3-gypsy retroelement transposase n=1 Tax=Cucumis melo var. makuwa TaxID=1194695 RepID=A0A5A7VKR0_CUCMM|nr:ty3-gypsy retroelement transposase [Cucumis melo var. makuwa]